MLDVGCGVGNATVPLLRACPSGSLFIYACDYSQVAISKLQENLGDWSKFCYPFVWDISGEVTQEIRSGSLDAILCVYVLSAIHPKNHAKALKHLVR